MKTFITFLLIILIYANASAQCYIKIAAGDSHTLAIRIDGTLWAWGRNDYGQLGDGSTVNKNTPTQIGLDNNWQQIDAFGYQSIALKTDGSLWGWGRNDYGQVGDGNHGNGVINSIPTRVGIDTDWVVIDAGGTFAIKNNGSLWGWGFNETGKLGTGESGPHYTPVQIGIATDWSDVSSGPHQVLAVKTNHTLWGWGLNKNGSLAIGPPSQSAYITIPTQTGNNTADWQKVEVGSCCDSKMIKIDSSLWAMGLGYHGNLGNGTFTDVNTPTRIGIDNDWSTISTYNHSCALKVDGKFWIWGANYQGQLGDGTLTNKSNPVQLGNETWLSAEAGLLHTVAIAGDHSLYAWGWNNYGQLGDGTFIDKIVPIQIGTPCPLSIVAFETLGDLKAYPVPTKDKVILQYMLTDEAVVTTTISNNLGQLLYSTITNKNVGNQHEPIDLMPYAKGVYFITIYTNNLRNTVKVIKQ